MGYARITLLVTAAATLTMAACSKPASEEATAAATTPAAESDPVRSAMSAAPAAVAEKAAIVTAAADGSMTTVREGTNGFTCMPDNPATPGPDPMCMDANAMTWAMAWIGKKPPPTQVPGLMYMLEGGTDASNTDPYATKPEPGQNRGDWIKTGPHVMIVGSHAVLAGYPSGPQPDTRAPYVMWADTPYAHLMVPVN